MYSIVILQTRVRQTGGVVFSARCSFLSQINFWLFGAINLESRAVGKQCKRTNVAFTSLYLTQVKSRRKQRRQEHRMKQYPCSNWAINFNLSDVNPRSVLKCAVKYTKGYIENHMPPIIRFKVVKHLCFGRIIKESESFRHCWSNFFICLDILLGSC